MSIIDKSKYWIAVDFDSVLMLNEEGDGHAIREPIEPIVNLVKKWIKAGYIVKIFTARAYEVENWFLQGGTRLPRYELYKRDIKPIEDWCQVHFGKVLPVTSMKAPHLIAILDDRAIRVEKNTGRILNINELAAILPI